MNNVQCLYRTRLDGSWLCPSNPLAPALCPGTAQYPKRGSGTGQRAAVTGRLLPQHQRCCTGRGAVPHGTGSGAATRLPASTPPPHLVLAGPKAFFRGEQSSRRDALPPRHTTLPCAGTGLQGPSREGNPRGAKCVENSLS